MDCYRQFFVICFSHKLFMISLTYIISLTPLYCVPPCTKHHRFAHLSSLGAQYPIHSSEAVNISLSTTYTFMYVDFSLCVVE
jgi:hypothetical protein